MNKKVLFILALLCSVAQGAWAENVTFIVRSWDEGKKQVVSTTVTKDATVLNSSNDWIPLGASDNLDDHYYVVKGNVSIKTLNCFGRAHLILADNATLTCTGGIVVNKTNNDAKLFIYGQSGNTGKLTVTTSYERAAGIGSTAASECGEINIHGGIINVTGAQYAAGIGAGGHDDFSTFSPKVAMAGTIKIFGGDVTAQGGDSGAGIGGGSTGFDTERGSDGGFFYLYGGTVTATGGEYAAGVGGGGGRQAVLSNRYGCGGRSGKVRIYGGKLTAQGGHRAAGIGAGNNGDGGHGDWDKGFDMYVYDGIVNATGGDYGAGIGGGCNCNGGDVHIDGGYVTAKGGEDAAGIGGGEDGWGGILHVGGGTVRAEGKGGGAGIGGGECTGHWTKPKGMGAEFYVTGGTVIAIAGNECQAREAKGGSAIGCGHGLKSKDDSDRAKVLEIPDNYMVTGGDAENNIERIFTAAEREPACRWRNYVKIEACDHTTPTEGNDKTEAKYYTINGDQHTMHCRYCAYTEEENHTFVEDVCSYCGKRDNTSDDMWSVTLHRASVADTYSYADRVVMKVVKGQTFTLPAVSATEGLTLMGYATSWTENMGIEMKDGETLTEVGTVVTPEADMNYYPRYRFRYVPTWTWNDDDATATLSIKCSALSSEAVSVENINYTTSGDVKTATGTYVHFGATYTFTDTYLLPSGNLILRNTASNDAALDNYKGKKANTVTLQGRTLHADGSWNTLCLPFSLSQEEVYTYLYPTALKTLGSTSFNNETNTLTLNFIDATTIEAGKPYIIKWTSGGNRTNPSFNKVAINDVNAAVETDYVNFAGSFSPVSLAANDKTVLYLGDDNKLYYPNADMTVGSCRAVFLLKGLTAGNASNNINNFVLNFGDESTGIVSVSKVSEKEGVVFGWFTLDGRRLSSKPTAKGIYINNGHKVLIK